MRVVRFSKTGFKPRYQDHHLKHILYELNDFDVDLIKRAFHKSELLKKHEYLVDFYTKNFDDFRYGIWCFKEGYRIGPELNHLKQAMPRWTADLPDDVEVYDFNLESKYVLKDYPYGAMYVPKRSLKNISNVHRAPKKYIQGVA